MTPEQAFYINVIVNQNPVSISDACLVIAGYIFKTKQVPIQSILPIKLNLSNADEVEKFEQAYDIATYYFLSQTSEGINTGP